MTALKGHARFVLARLRDYARPRKKAIVAGVVGAVATLAAHLGTPLTEVQLSAVQTVAGLLFVYFISNEG